MTNSLNEISDKYEKYLKVWSMAKELTQGPCKDGSTEILGRMVVNWEAIHQEIFDKT